MHKDEFLIIIILIIVIVIVMLLLLLLLFSAKTSSVFDFQIFDINITAMYINLFMGVKYSLWSFFATTMDIIGNHVALLILY